MLGRSTGEEDKIVWKASKSGAFSVKSFYSTLQLQGEVSSPSKIVWALGLLAKWVFFGFVSLP